MGTITGTFPNLDNLALYADGNMEVYYSDEKTAQEYQEMGAVDVLAFGPVLVRDGQLNTEALEKYGTSHAPRTAIGMVEKGALLCHDAGGPARRQQWRGHFLPG